ncbi:hypothetical protein [Jiangella sp. DSM 45060]|uniref:hypothetical protein n=1 Tax=Jiangella sp. DSM 45060 TaxID=1798224 RepID=UPI000879A8D7|nr:hypothetical protein [Jiangella sp. DSM 45060]SDT12795.1 hypothetical protein SAMN04515669_2859 [Jiangella sp. DSM 45060]
MQPEPVAPDGEARSTGSIVGGSGAGRTWSTRTRSSRRAAGVVAGPLREQAIISSRNSGDTGTSDGTCSTGGTTAAGTPTRRTAVAPCTCQ